MDSHFASLSVFLKKSRNVRRSELAICSTFDCCHFQNSMFISQNFSKFVILRIISFTHVPQHVSTHQPGQPSTLKVANPSTPPQHLDTELRINGGDFASLVAFFALHKALRDLDSGRNDSLEGWEFLGKTWRILSGKKNTTITLGKTTWWICFFCWY